jgi:ADP-L-glycero-D-manno-heptose 6-epimerase
MKILVTGARGFVGKQLLDSLFLQGYDDVLGIDDEYLQGEWKKNIDKILNDLDPSVIFHVGACSDTLEQNVNYMMVRNYESTKFLCDWCSQHPDKKIIYSSSAANYGVNRDYPSNLYGWSKYVAEDYVLSAGGVALRYFNVYGPGEGNKGKMSSFLHQAYQKTKTGQEVLLFPKKPTRDFIYIKDVVSANVHAMINYDQNKGKYYEISTSISSEFEEMMDLAGIEYRYLPENCIPIGYQYYTCGDSKKWMKGWTPEYSLSRGVEEYISFLGEEK